MKILKYIGIALLIIIIAAGIATGGYFLAVWHTNDKNDAVKTATNSTTQNTVADTALTPAKTTTTPTCNADELSLATAANGDSGAGTLSFNLILTNTGKRDCTLAGYPGVSLVNDNGNQVGSPAERTTNVAEKTVSLKPQATTTATLYYTDDANFYAGTCKEGATKLRLYPPNDTGYLSVALPSDVAWCPGFEISPVQ